MYVPTLIEIMGSTGFVVKVHELETLLDAHEPPGVVIDAVLTWRGRGHRFRLANWRYGKACAGPHS